MAKVIFRGYHNSYGEEPWISDGTFDGTQLVRNLYSGTSGSLSDISPPAFTELDGLIYFSAGNTLSGPGHGSLLVTDGTFVGTQVVKDFSDSSGGSPPTDLFAFNGKIFFQASDGTTGIEPWVSDGTPSGTLLLADIHPTQNQSSQAFSAGGIIMDGSYLYFDAYDNVASYIYRTDGTPGGTEVISQGGLGGGGELIGNLLVFPEYSAAAGTELAVVDVTTKIKTVIDIWTGTDSTNPQSFAKLGNAVLFAAHDDANFNQEVWITDGTAGGTMKLKDINQVSNGSGGTNGSYPYLAEGIELNGNLLFSADDGVHGRELWTTDGTETGTTLLLDVDTREFAPGSPYSSNPGNFVKMGNIVFFTASATAGTELWRTDGSAGGTFKLADGNVLLTGTNYAISNGKLFVINNADDFIVTDGTVSGTTTIDAAFTGDDPEDLTAFGNGVIYQARVFATHGEELYYTDGTESGSGLVRDIRPGQQSFDPDDFVVFGDRRFTGFSDTVTLENTGENVDALAGDDDVTGGSGNDTIMGGLGFDHLKGGDGEDILQGGAGGDILDGGASNDTASYADSLAVNVQIQYGIVQDGYAGDDTLISIENLTGSAYNDTLTGDEKDNVLTGGEGDDILRGLGGVDHLIGGDGDDWLFVDSLDAAGGTIDGGLGTMDRLDVVNGNGVSLDLDAAGIEIARGNIGNEVFDGSTSSADLTMRGRSGNDILTGGSGDDYLYGDAGQDQLIGGAGLDRLFIDAADFDTSGGFTPMIDGGAGSEDRVFVTALGSMTPTQAGVSLNMLDHNVEVAYGNFGHDTFDGSSSSDVLSLYGYGGNDTLIGGS
ncbi:MAG: hypothetical protein KDJ77_17240, partial [Rhodobiaceae bacterium]|nr:hypothetical protein [Rhodobiaceae bacterium]